MNMFLLVHYFTGDTTTVLVKDEADADVKALRMLTVCNDISRLYLKEQKGLFSVTVKEY